MSKWTTRTGRELKLVTPAELDTLEHGTTLYSIFDESVIVGVHKIDRDTRFGYCAFGFDVTNYEQKFRSLQDAVRETYYAARWQSDRLAGEQEAELWTKVRDAAGFEPGGSPAPLPDADFETTVVGVGTDNVEGGIHLTLRVAAKDATRFLKQRIHLTAKMVIRSKPPVKV